MKKTFSFERILDEHRELLELVHELQNYLEEPRPRPGSRSAMTWATGLSEKLLRLHDQLVAHFREEEDSGALEELRRRHPQAVDDIALLQTEHEDVLQELRSNLETCMIYAQGKPVENPHLRRRVLDVLHKLRSHERRESDLIARTVATTDFEEALDDELAKYRLDEERQQLCVEALQKPIREVGWNRAETVPCSATVLHVVETLQQSGNSCVIVMRGQEMAGFICERDLITRVLGKSLDLKRASAEKIMTPGVFTMRPSEPVCHALSLMDLGGYRYVVVAQAGELFGVVTARSLLHYINRLVPEDVRLLPRDETPTDRYGG